LLDASQTITVITQAYAYAEAAHAGQTRLRRNKRRRRKKTPESPREYICHPLEIAFISARYHLVRGKQRRGYKMLRPLHFLFRSAAKDIVRNVEVTAQLHRDEIKNALLNLAPAFNDRQIIRTVAYLNHDTIEKSYSRNPPEGQTAAQHLKHKRAIIDKRLSEIKAICAGADEIVWHMTDEPEITKDDVKRQLQLDWAKQKANDLAESDAKNGKGFDFCVNLFDLNLIPDDKWNLSKKRAQAIHMKAWMDQADDVHPNIRMAFYIIYKRVARKLGLEQSIPQRMTNSSRATGQYLGVKRRAGRWLTAMAA
jgi:hypothetical protein